MLCLSTGRDLRACGKLCSVLNARGGDRPRERQPVRPGRRRLEQQHQHLHGGGGGGKPPRHSRCHLGCVVLELAAFLLWVGRRRDGVGQRHDEQLGIPGAVRCAPLAALLLLISPLAELKAGDLLAGVQGAPSRRAAGEPTASRGWRSTSSARLSRSTSTTDELTLDCLRPSVTGCC